MTSRVLPGILLMALSPFVLWLLPQPMCLYGHLLGVPVLWGIVAFVFLPRQRLAILGSRKFWPFAWIPGLLALSLGFLGVGYFGDLVVFSYGLTRPQVAKHLFLPMFVAVTTLMTFGVERPLRQMFCRDLLLGRGVAWPIAMMLCSALGVLRSLPFYWTDWLDMRYFAFALLNLFIMELTLTRLYLVSGNLLACGVYHAIVVLVNAFVLSDVLSPYLPAFHWISSSTTFYVLMSCFLALPLAALCLLNARNSEFGGHITGPEFASTGAAPTQEKLAVASSQL